MKASIVSKLEKFSERLEEINGLLSDPTVINNQDRYRTLSMEHSQLTPVATCFTQYQNSLKDLAAAMEMQKDGDLDMREMADEELKSVQARIAELELELQKLLLPVDPHDKANVFLEVRAGTGGDEAAIFAGDLYRMYARYAETQGWQVEVVSENAGEHGGYKEVIARIMGKGVYSRLKFESGAHRVQRVPETEAQGRVHTSACTVAVMPEVDAVEEIPINPADLRVDTYRASGAGGQHVNRTESAIRLTHLPTGLIVECQDERSQHKNRARAMGLLQAKIFQQQVDKQAAEQAATRKSLVGSGDRSERIRTYNFPQGRLTDHRINLTLYKLGQIIEGDLEAVINALINEHQADQLASLSGDRL